MTATGGTVDRRHLADDRRHRPAVSETRFTYTAPASGNFTNTITAASRPAAAYTSATATASK